MFDKGTQLELPYPVCTTISLLDQAAIRDRNIIVHECRDLFREPLQWQEFQRRPYIHRSRWLIRAWDVDLQRFRQFYAGSSPRFRSPGILRLALYEPGATRPSTWLGNQFEPTAADRKRMLRLVERWLASPEAAINPNHLLVVPFDLALRRL